MENSLPLNDFQVKKTEVILNRTHIFLHGIALLALFHYRITTLIQLINTNNKMTLFPYVLIFSSEIVLSFLWVLSQPSKWRPIKRQVYVERLPENDKLPSIDVFICTADPNKEPSLGVMNTVVSALSLDYPPNKLHVYLSDDGGCFSTFRAVQEAWKFSKVWIRFCRKYEVKNRCPEAYFLNDESNGNAKFDRTSEFGEEKKKIQERYDDFKDRLVKIIADTGGAASRNHPTMIEVIGDHDERSPEKDDMPILVYVAREKRPSRPHNFKAGSLNTMLRVSAMISNSPYILVLDCDMYCNDPTSARQAMCFLLDSELSQNLAFVQFPQKFHTISETDIYDGQLRYVWQKWEGMDGLRGPILSGTGFYIKREALYGTRKFGEDIDLNQLQKSYGSSNEFIKSFYKNHIPNHSDNTKVLDNVLRKEIEILASCDYDKDTNWGKEVGFRYFTIVEDYFTGFNLQCEGWISVYFDPSRPGFLGASPVSLGEVLVQHTRWYVGLMQVGLSRFSPLLYRPSNMPILQSICYAEFAYASLSFVPFYCLAIIPQLCLVRGIAIYPEVCSPFFLLFSFIFLSSQLKHVHEIISSGNSAQAWANEQRIWMLRSATSLLYATFNATIEKLGFTDVKFLPTNKVVDDEQAKRYRMGVYDFQASPMFMVPLCSLYLLNLASFVVGLVRILNTHKGNEMYVQCFIPLFGIVLFYPLFEGMILRKDKGRVSPFVTLISFVTSTVVLCCVSY